jgi:hypothetical protein
MSKTLLDSIASELGTLRVLRGVWAQQQQQQQQQA